MPFHSWNTLSKFIHDNQTYCETYQTKFSAAPAEEVAEAAAAPAEEAPADDAAPAEES